MAGHGRVCLALSASGGGRCSITASLPGGGGRGGNRASSGIAHRTLRLPCYLATFLKATGRTRATSGWRGRKAWLPVLTRRPLTPRLHRLIYLSSRRAARTL